MPAIATAIARPAAEAICTAAVFNHAAFDVIGVIGAIS